MQDAYDLIVIGAGPGGYVAAIKAAKLGMKTAIIENREVGGTCLNRGCIPAKAMLHAAKLYQEVLSAERFGIIANEVSFDFHKILTYKNETSTSLRQGVEQLLKGNKIELIKGTGVLTKDGYIKVKTDGREEILQSENVLLATGSKPFQPPIEGINLPGIMTSDEIFELDHVPDSLLIIGGGVIGVEFATVFSSFGSKVTIVEATDRLLPNMDKEISQNLKLLLKKRGITIHTGAFVQKIEKEGNDFICTFTVKAKDKDKSKEKDKENYEQNIEIIQVPYILSAVGRIANTHGLLEDGVTLEMNRGKISVNEKLETSIPNVYAIGDVTGGIQLAHAASAQGIYAVETMKGKEPTIDLSVVPACVYTDPEIACVGMTEEEAKEKGIEIVAGKFLTLANGKSQITKEERGFVKIIVDKEKKIILGAQLMCARATDMIAELGTAIVNQLTAEQLLKAMRAHPTYNESIAEALEDCFGEAIHVMPRN